MTGNKERVTLLLSVTSNSKNCCHLKIKVILTITVHPPICGFFMAQRSVHKSGFVHKSENALYLSYANHSKFKKYTRIVPNFKK